MAPEHETTRRGRSPAAMSSAGESAPDPIDLSKAVFFESDGPSKRLATIDELISEEVQAAETDRVQASPLIAAGEKVQARALLNSAALHDKIAGILTGIRDEVARGATEDVAQLIRDRFEKAQMESPPENAPSQKSSGPQRIKRRGHDQDLEVER